MRASFAIVLALASLAAGAPPAAAQSGQWDGHARISINAGMQASSTTFDESTSISRYLESAPITASFEVPSGPVFDVSAAIRLRGNLGVGVALSSMSVKRDAAVTASIPHPFFYSQPRGISGTAAAQERGETATHLAVVYLIPSSGKLDLLLSGGPSFFSVQQDLVTDVAYSETYPFDTASFTSATSARASKTAVGFHVAADVAWKFNRNIGVGGLIRFARASATLSVPGSTGTTVKVDAGGVQAGGGIRFFF